MLKFSRFILHLDLRFWKPFCQNIFGHIFRQRNRAALKAGIRNPENRTGIRNPETGIRNPETGIQKKLQDSAIRLYNNCLEIMSTKMLYFSNRDTKDKNSN